MYHDYLAYDGYCGTSKTAAGRDEKKKERRHVWGLHGPGWLYDLAGKQSHDYLPDFATLNAQNTRHGARPGPKLAARCTGGPPACPAAESARKDSRPEEQTFYSAKKSISYIYLYLVPGTRYCLNILLKTTATLYPIVEILVKESIDIVTYLVPILGTIACCISLNVLVN